MKKVQRSAFNFKLNPIAASIVLAMSSQFVTSAAIAGSGWGAGNFSSAPAVTAPVPTYYANSPAGPVTALDPVTGLPSVDPVTDLTVKVDSGKALRKFVDTLPGIPGITSFSGTMTTVDGKSVTYDATQANNLGQYIPVAVPVKWVDTNGVTTNDDYYEIAAVEYTEQLHSDIVDAAGVPHKTRLRGYVQIDTGNIPNSKKIPLTYPNGKPILDVNGNQVLAVDNPQHLGPIINAASGTAVRIKFDNYLPFATKASPTDGDLWLPVDKTLAGSGLGPDGVSYYTENRAEIRLIGGDTPWVSGGSPHQWVAPRRDYNANVARLFKGDSVQNVPDMPRPEKGSVTLYFPNQQSSRFTFYEDRTSGMTRLNVYAGMAAGYFVTDPTEASLIASGTIPADQVPLILEDKTFVPDNIAQQDAKWDTTHWGQPGDLWFPHVYEANQDPNTIDGANPVGRWDYGPWFWPVFPAPTTLPTGEYGNASFVPEAYQDTPLVNGTAYPTVTLDPKAYRFRLLNASTDRYFNLGLYLADTTVKAPELDRNGNPVFAGANAAQSFYSNTEVKMIPAVGDANGNPPVPQSLVGLPYDPTCLCQYPNLPQLQDANQFSGPNRAWPTDNRLGGAPDPTAVGPDFIAIGNGGGVLPNPVDIPSQPVTYEMNRRSITVGNIYGYGMLLGPQERADAIVDFSAYAGKTLILYNDAPAPVPFIDLRDDYYTGDPDYTTTGGAYSTLPGYGPNTRTVMQIVIRNTTPAAPFNASNLLTALPAAYAATQPAPIVPESGYNAAFGTGDTDNYAHVASGSVAQPNLDFTPSAANLVMDRVDLITSGGTQLVGTNNISGNAVPGTGSGYDPANPPTVVFNDGNCLPATGTRAQATATVDPSSKQVTAVTLTNPGAGYTCAPQISFADNSGGVGAQAVAHFATTKSIMVQDKAEQELFDNAGRYNSTGGVEIPFINAVNQDTIPLSYPDSPTEIIQDGEVQIWKIVDNGLWTNSMHFDGFDVQLINRVGWDGTVKVPAMNELGWKDTLRLNPLEDVILAVRAHNAKVPFGQPSSSRLQDPAIPAGTNYTQLGNVSSALDFMANPGPVSPTVSSVTVTAAGQGYRKNNTIVTFTPQPGDAGSGAEATVTVSPYAGGTGGQITGIVVTNPGGGYTAAPTVTISSSSGTGASATAVIGTPLLTTQTNVTADYDNEFTWGSAILGHAENDFTRPIVFHPTVTRPDAPVLTISGTTLNWTDPTPAATSLGNPMNEINFQVQEQIVDATTGAVTQSWKLVANLPANTTTWTAPAAPAAGTMVYFRVRARNLAGGTWSIVQQML
jgi:hypothetical protein